jgi:hypothetical protein
MRFPGPTLPLIFLTGVLAAQAPAGAPAPRIPSEDISWELSYGPIRLGRLTLSSRASGGALVLRLRIGSDPGLPVERLEAVYETTVGLPDLLPRSASGSSAWGRERTDMSYDFSSIPGAILYEGTATKGGKPEGKRGEIRPAEGVLDGLSFILRLMLHCDAGGEERLMVLSAGKGMPMRLDYRRGLAATSGPRGREAAGLVLGRVEGKGLGGLTGAFRVWVRDDESRLPLRAELGAWIGTVTLTLIESS